jgi:hypothetical protein
VIRFISGFCLILLLSNFVSAQQQSGHYPPGAEGLKAATLPPPGTYLKWYNFVYDSGTLRDANGHSVPVGFDLDVFATVPRLIKMTDYKFLGADYGMDIAVPFVNVDLQVAAQGIKQAKSGLGDILVEPLVLGWHFKQLDLGVAAGVWCPTGDYSSASPVNVGKGYWTGMYSFGGTYYFDEDKTWHLSALCRYESSSTKTDRDIRPGDCFHIEWGLGKTIAKNWNVGLTAYTQWQTTRDSGSAVTYDNSIHDSFYSLGPEINYFYAPYKTFFSVRTQTELGVVGRAQGQNTVISLTKVF